MLFHDRFACIACEQPLCRYLAINYGWVGSHKGSKASILKQTPGGSHARSGAITKHGGSKTHEFAWTVYCILNDRIGEVHERDRKHIHKLLTNTTVQKFIKANPDCVEGVDLQKALDELGGVGGLAADVAVVSNDHDDRSLAGDMTATRACVKIAYEVASKMLPAAVYENMLKLQQTFWQTVPSQVPAERTDQRNCIRIARAVSLGEHCMSTPYASTTVSR